MISVVVTAYNDAVIIVELTRRLKHVLERLDAEFEVIFVDDGSTDQTPDIVEGEYEKDSRIKYVQFSRNFGQGIAIRAGFDYAKGDIVVIMDGDLQELPEEIPKLVEKIKDGYDVAYGLRIHRKDSIFRRITSWCLRKFLAFNIRKGDMPRGDDQMLVGVFRAMNRSMVSALKNLPEHTAYVQGLIRWVGFQQVTVQVEHGKRFYGESKYNLRGLLRYATDGIIATTTYPLRFATYLGFVIAVASFAVGVYEVVYRVLFGTIAAGFTTLILVVLFLGGVQLCILGILGEYIGRIYTETKDRPLYIIRRLIL